MRLVTGPAVLLLVLGSAACTTTSPPPPAAEATATTSAPDDVGDASTVRGDADAEGSASPIPTTETSAPSLVDDPDDPTPLVETGTVTTDAPLDAPGGVATAADGRTFVADAGNHQVVVLDDEGAQVRTIGTGPGDDEGVLETLGFGSVAVGAGPVGGPAEVLAVVDNGNHRVQLFDLDGTFLTAFGREGEGEGAFVRAIGVDVRAGEVHVTDDAQPWVQVFDLDGTFLRRYGGEGVLAHPTGILLADDGSSYVADYDRRTVTRVDADGAVTATWTSPSPTVVPEGLVQDASGAILVADYRSGDVRVLPADPGAAEWPVLVDGGSLEPALDSPTDLAIAPDGVLVIADQGGDAVRRLVRDDG